MNQNQGDSAVSRVEVVPDISDARAVVLTTVTGFHARAARLTYADHIVSYRELLHDETTKATTSSKTLPVI